MQTTKNLYSVLELSRGASQDDIRGAYRKLVREHHPDTNPGDPSAEDGDVHGHIARHRRVVGGSGCIDPKG